jgi:hypothetical protein
MIVEQQHTHILPVSTAAGDAPAFPPRTNLIFKGEEIKTKHTAPRKVIEGEKNESSRWD